MFSSKSVAVFGVNFFCRYCDREPSHVLWWGCSATPRSLAERLLFPSLNCLMTVDHKHEALFLTLNCIAFTLMSVLHCFDSCGFVVCFESAKYELANTVVLEGKKKKSSLWFCRKDFCDMQDSSSGQFWLVASHQPTQTFSELCWSWALIRVQDSLSYFCSLGYLHRNV